MQGMSDVVSPPTQSTAANGAVTLTTYQPTMYTEEELRSNKNGMRKPYRDAQAGIKKLDETKENMAAYKNNQLKLKATVTILKKLKAGNVSASVLADMFDELKRDPDIMQNPELAKILDVNLKRFTQGGSGFDVGTEAATGLTVFVQKMRDYLKAIPLTIGNLAKHIPGYSKLNSLVWESGGDDSLNDPSTRSRLKDMEKWSENVAREFNGKIIAANVAADKSFALAQATANSAEKAAHFKDALAHQVTAYQTYLLAQNAMTKVTLTYTYAGMVQGQSGGRAISNEDFAILYRAIWGGAGGRLAEGSFDRLEDIVTSLGIRAENDLKYLKIKGGQSIKRRMLILDRKLNRQRFKRLYDESKNFNLLDHERGNAPQSAKRAISLPIHIITKINGQDSDKIDSTNMINHSKTFSNIFSQVTKALPKRLPKKRGGGKLPFAGLSPSDKKKIHTDGLRQLVILNQNSKLREGFNNYGFNTSKLGDIITKIGRTSQLNRLIKEETNDIQKAKYRATLKTISLVTDEYRFATQVIEHLYDNK